MAYLQNRDLVNPPKGLGLWPAAPPPLLRCAGVPATQGRKDLTSDEHRLDSSYFTSHAVV